VLALFYAGLLGLWALAPVMSLAAGPEAWLDPEDYYLYPVPRRTLFALALFSTALHPLAWPLYVAAAASSVPWLGAAPTARAFAAPAALAAVGVAWSSAVASVLLALSRTRRLREWAVAAGSLAVAAIFLLPNFLTPLADRWRDLPDAAAALRAGGAGAWAAAARGLAWTPAGLAARWVAGTGGAAPAVASLAVGAALGLAAAYAAFRWSLGRPEATRTRHGSARRSWLARALARTRSARTALALKEWAYLWRDPHLRLAVALPALLWVALVATRAFRAVGALGLLVFVTLNAVGQSGTNLLGRDRAGFESWLWAPLRGRDILAAKATAHLALFAAQLALLAAVGMASGRIPGPALALVAAAATAAALILLAGGQWLSVVAPYPVDPRRRAAPPGGSTVLLPVALELGTAFVVGAAVGLPYWLWGRAAAFAGAAAALGLGAFAFRAASDCCGALLEARRETVREALRARG
jgi:hypothetical protein